jgi:hypothetical protein
MLEHFVEAVDNERIDDVNTLWRARENDVKPEPESYGKTEWIAADVLKSAEEQGIEITEEEANTLLQLCDENISERQIERGWDIINGEVEAYNRERTDKATECLDCGAGHDTGHHIGEICGNCKRGTLTRKPEQGGN